MIMTAAHALYATPECEEWEATFERHALESYRERMGHSRPLAERAAEGRKAAEKAPRIRRQR